MQSTRDAKGQVTTYGYGSGGNLTSFVDANGKVTGFGYDANGYLAWMADALGNRTEYVNDANGNRLQGVREAKLQQPAK